MPLHLLLVALSFAQPSQDFLPSRDPLPSQDSLSSRNPLPSQDSLPSLHSLQADDIDTVIASRKTMTLTVKLKTGVTYVYDKKDWSKEDDGKLNPKLNDGTGLLTMTFIKVEHPPVFPGGEEAFGNYIRDICTRNRKLVRKEGPAIIIVQFIVDQNGEISYVQPISGGKEYPQLARLAQKAIEEGPAWTPATQNGHKVVCYHKQQITFE